MEIQIDSAADQSILSALREGKHRQAASLLVRYYGNTVFCLCRTMVPQVDEAEDLTQESFRSAFSALGGIQGHPSPRAWLMKVAQRCCADHLKQYVGVQEELPSLDREVPAEAANWRISESLQRRLEVLASAL
jgi:DNA-directed RNA polymerase specialized sigma24 family protein